MLIHYFFFGDSAQRPVSIPEGFQYFDTTLKKPTWWDGINWVDVNNDNIDFKKIGAFNDKPSSPSIGFQYFCTDRQTSEGATNGIMIYHKGDNIWMDALGRVVS